MDHPMVSLQRRNSAPTRRNSSLLMRLRYSKSNPYIGTFRHSPPTALSSVTLRETQTTAALPTWMSLSSASAVSMKKSPYVGSFRHSPPMSRDTVPFLRKLYELLKDQGYGTEVSGCRISKYLISGHLKGGSPVWDWSSRHQATSRRQSSLPVLGRIAYWILESLQDTSSTPRIKDVPENYREELSVATDEDGDDDSSYLSDDDDYTAGSDSEVSGDDDADSNNSQDADGDDYYDRMQDSTILSSQAEAYYAHAMTKDILQDHRLDYNITQMDVIRMTRNASRHLDVDSIVKLPVYTYHKKEEKQVPEQPKPRQQQQQENSWLMVSQEEAEIRRTGSASSHETTAHRSDVCVICLDPFVNGDRVRVLPCSHSFHVGCIDRWLSGSHSFDDCVTSGCPTCKKRPVPRAGVHSFDEEPQASIPLDGSVPSWSFSMIGNALARGQH